MNQISSDYVFAITNQGSEKALKLEVGTMQLGWRSSYQRKGFVTFKTMSETEKFSLRSLEEPIDFARRLCLSLGKASTREEAIALVENSQKRRSTSSVMIHHVRLDARLLDETPEPPKPSKRPRLGQLVGTVVELGPEEFWAGLHVHSDFLSPDAGGNSQTMMPPDSPSRAWLKLEEAVRFFDLKFSRHDIAVELGCAPGGVVLALLRRGVSVIGVDPAEMADVVMEFGIPDRQSAPYTGPWFYHCRKPASRTGKRDLGYGVTWFMSDMNLSPDVVLKECARFCKMAPEISGALMTFKLTDLSMISEKQKWIAAVADIGFKTIVLQQMSVHHRELVMLALM